MTEAPKCPSPTNSGTITPIPSEQTCSNRCKGMQTLPPSTSDSLLPERKVNSKLEKNSSIGQPTHLSRPCSSSGPQPRVRATLWMFQAVADKVHAGPALMEPQAPSSQGNAVLTQEQQASSSGSNAPPVHTPSSSSTASGGAQPRRSSRIAQRQVARASGAHVEVISAETSSSLTLQPQRSQYSRASQVRRDQQQCFCDVPNCTYHEPFTRQSDLRRHQETVHGMSPRKFRCLVCERTCFRRDKLMEHCRKQHSQGGAAEPYPIKEEQRTGLLLRS